MKIVIDHLSGSRRGQRQEFAERGRISFGRHPSCDVSFDAARDLDASTQHAELDIDESVIALRDVGSSNGTFVAGEQISTAELEAGKPVVVEFGRGGPQLRLWVGDGAAGPPPAPNRGGAHAPRIWFVVIAFVVIASTVAMVVHRWGT